MQGCYDPGIESNPNQVPTMPTEYPRRLSMPSCWTLPEKRWRQPSPT
jgi:hypothetical protein